MVVDKVDTLQYLKQLGLTDNESKVYLAIVGRPSMTILEISKSINIPRSTVYRATEDLVTKKFAEWIIDEHGKRIRARKPKDLDFLVEEKETDLEATKSALENLSGSIQEIVSNLPETQVRYYRGKDGIKQIIWNTLKAKKEIFGYSEFGRIEITGKSFYNKYVNEFKLRKLKDRAITNENWLGYINKHVLSSDQKHQLDPVGIRIIPKKIFYVTGDTSIYNNVYATGYWRDNEIVGVEIENPEMVKLHKSIFEILWGVAKPLGEYIKGEI